MAAKAKKSGAPRRVEIPEIELRPDAWERFESLVKSAAKMGHKPHGEPGKPKRQKRTTKA